MDDLIAFLQARLDEDEHAANAWLPLGNPTAAERNHIARHDPARVLADVAAKRAIVDLHSPHHHGACPVCWLVTKRSSLREDFPCRTLRTLALPHSDHPDYREEWRP
jgi:hypothetical protein